MCTPLGKPLVTQGRRPQPLTKENFEIEFKISTGLNWLTVDWILAHNPSDWDAKYQYFAKLLRYIEPLEDHYVGVWGSEYPEYEGKPKLIKYGRFRLEEMGGSGEYPGVTKREHSDLVEILAELIFEGKAWGQYLLDKTGEYILTLDGQKINVK